MGQVSVTLNNRTYKLACNDGEEARLADLARDVKTRVENLAREFGQPADERILLMAAVLLADELMDLREAHEAMLAAAAEVLREAAAQPAGMSESDKPATVAAKNEAGRLDTSKSDAAKPTTAQQDAGKGQARPSQPSNQSPAKSGGGSGHPALPQAPSAQPSSQSNNKAAKTSTG